MDERPSGDGVGAFRALVLVLALVAFVLLADRALAALEVLGP